MSTKAYNALAWVFRKGLPIIAAALEMLNETVLPIPNVAIYIGVIAVACYVGNSYLSADSVKYFTSHEIIVKDDYQL